MSEQPKPAPCHPAVWDMVVADMQARDHVAAKRFGVRHQPFNGRCPLRDAYEETLYQAVYLRQAIYEAEQPPIDAVYLDMDGVLVDFVAGAMAAHGASMDKLIPGEWYIEKWLGITLEEFWAPCQGHDFWANLPWLPDGMEIISLLLERVPFDHVWLLTSPSHDPGSFSGKYAWIQRHLPGWARRVIMAPSKWPLARRGAVIIEDNDTVVSDWKARGSESILMPRLWNSRHEFLFAAIDYLEMRLDEMKHRFVA